MKKFALLAAALAFTSTAAFADPALTLSAYVDSGVKAQITEDGTTYQNYAGDWDDDEGGVRAKIGAAYNGEKAGFVATAALSSEKDVTLDTAYGWVSPIEGFKLFAGTSYSGVFAGLDDTGNDYFDTKGVSAVYTNSGFTIGAGFIAPVVAGHVSQAVYGAGYSLDKVGAIVANASTADKKINNVSVSGSLSAVENLSLSAGYVGEGVATEITQWVDFTAGYDVTPEFSAGLIAYDYVTAEYFGFTPNATYKVSDAFSLYGEVAFATARTVAGVDVDANYAPKVKGTYTVDAQSTVTAYAQYDANAKTTTVALDYLFSF